MKHIIFASDNNYAMPCMVAIASLLCNTDYKDCDIHILTDGFSSKNCDSLNRLRNLFNGANIQLDIVKDNSLLNNAIVSTRFPVANFFRLLIPTLYDFDKALYLDCDIIVNKDISEIWNTDISDYSCAMVTDQDSEDITLHNRIKSYDSTYFNAGVLLMNLNYWRDKKIAKKIFNFMKDFPERCLYPDQDAINAVLSNSILELPYQYNVQENWFKPNDMWKVHRKRWEKIQKALCSPVIIHYTGHDKPWLKVCPHPLSTLYNKYLTLITQDNGSTDITEYKGKECVKWLAESHEYINKVSEIERKRRHKNIRRANLFMILFAVETLAVLGYIIYSLAN